MYMNVEVCVDFRLGGQATSRGVHFDHVRYIHNSRTISIITAVPQIIAEPGEKKNTGTMCRLLLQSAAARLTLLDRLAQQQHLLLPSVWQAAYPSSNVNRENNTKMIKSNALMRVARLHSDNCFYLGAGSQSGGQAGRQAAARRTKTQARGRMAVLLSITRSVSQSVSTSRRASALCLCSSADTACASLALCLSLR